MSLEEMALITNTREDRYNQQLLSNDKITLNEKEKLQQRQLAVLEEDPLHGSENHRDQSQALFNIPLRGKVHEIRGKGDLELFYEHPNGELWVGDSIKWLSSLKSESVDLIFADPPYNIKKAEWDNFESQEHYIEWSLKWIQQAARVLKETGTLYICGFSEILADLKHPTSRYFKGCRWIIWHYKNKANLGNDWGRSHESLIHFRKGKKFIHNIDAVRIPYGAHTLKYPRHPQADTSQYGNGNNKNHVWFPHPQGAKPKDVLEIPTTCNGMEEKSPHPTQKPEELLRKFVLASSNVGDLVVDPFSGAGTTLVVAEQLKRKWKGCDTKKEYCGWAVDRLEKIKHQSIERWIEFDLANAKRREAIR